MTQKAPTGGAGVAAVVLAAGRSTRMGDRNKLLAKVGGRALVRTACEAVLEGGAHPVVVVTGHESHRVGAALRGLKVSLVDNPNHVLGMSTSLRVGLGALPAKLRGALIVLADMPRIDARTIETLISAFDPASGREIIVPTHAGKRGNPVLWSSRFFTQLAAVTGDRGGRALIGEHHEAVHQVEIGAAVSQDIDTPEDFDAIGETDS